MEQCPLFQNLSAAEKAALASAARVQKFAPQQWLFQQGQKAAGFYAVLSGQVEVLRRAADGREQILHIFRSGELVGEVPVFHGQAYPASAKAGEETLALYLDGERFIEVATESPSILLEMLSVLSIRLRRFTELIDDLSLKDVSGRLARYLLRKLDAADAPTTRVTLDGTKAQLASRLGTIAETFSRTLAKMKAQGVLEVSGNTLTILDREKLQRLAAGEKL